MNGRPRRMVPQRRREHLIETALALYSTRPPEQVSVEDITHAADVSRALFYRYFPNVAELHMAALGSVVQELTTRITLPPCGTPLEQLRVAVDEFFTVVERHAPAYLALQRAGSVIATGETAALIDSVRHHIVALLVQHGGLVSPSPLVMATLRGWVALVESTSVSWLEDRPIPRELLLDWLAAQLPAMLAVTGLHDGAAVVLT